MQEKMTLHIAALDAAPTLVVGREGASASTQQQIHHLDVHGEHHRVALYCSLQSRSAFGCCSIYIRSML